MRLAVQVVPLRKGRPQSHMAHHNRVKNAEFIEGELVLTENAEFLRAGDGTFGRPNLPRQNFHECRLAGAIRSRDRIAASWKECTGDILEQDLRAVAHRNVVNGKHVVLPTGWTS